MSLGYEVKYLLSLVDDDPTNWVVRKEAALKLYESGKYLESADMVWQTPEIPSTDRDAAFAVKMISRARPNRSIRLVHELLNRNAGKAEQNIAMANVFNLIGFPMLAARCYGGAMTLNDEYFDIGFESEAFFTDDSKTLKNGWAEYRDEDLKQSFSSENMDLIGDPIYFKDLTEELDEESFKNASEAAAGGDVEGLGAALHKLNRITPAIGNSGDAKPKLLMPVTPRLMEAAVEAKGQGAPAIPPPTPTLRFMPPVLKGDES